MGTAPYLRVVPEGAEGEDTEIACELCLSPSLTCPVMDCRDTHLGECHTPAVCLLCHESLTVPQ